MRLFSTTAAAARNTPARRPRDPADTGEKHPLPDGATLVVRAPPTPPATRTTVHQPSPLLAAQPAPAETDESAEGAALPPVLKARTPRASLTPAEIARLQQLRAADPHKHTRTALARQFGCSPLFVSMVAPLPKPLRASLSARDAAASRGAGLNKRISRAQREERRLLW
jgi:sulfide:quinone oxidoreductase